MLKNGKPANGEPKEGSRAQDKSPSLPLAEERASLTKVMQDLVSLRGILNDQSKLGPEERQSLHMKIAEGLKAHGFTAPEDGVDSSNRPGRPDRLYEAIDRAMIETLDSVNPSEINIRQLEVGNTDSGTKIFTSRNAAFIITDPEVRMDKSYKVREAVDAVMKAMSCIHSQSLYLAHMRIEGDLIGMQIDHGKHKGYIGVYCPECQAEAVVYFKHFEHGLGKFSGNRVAFVREALGGCGLPSSVSRRGRDSCEVRTMRHTIYKESVLVKLVRLSRAVKDLDMCLTTGQQASLASMMFSRGVTNMMEFLTSLKIRQMPPADRDPGLAEYEVKLLRESIDEMEKAESWAESIRKRHSQLRKVKDLNFSVLRLCTELQMAVLGYTKQGALVPKREIERRFAAVCLELVEMARACDGNSGTEESGWYERKAKALIEKYDTALSACGWTLSEGETERLMGMFADREGEITYENVATIGELIRLMHAKSILPPQFLMKHDRAMTSGSKELLMLDCAAPLSSGFVCLNLEEGVEADKLETYRILESLLRRTQVDCEDESFALVGADFADISMPQGKHYVEISADLDERNCCDVLHLRYFESGYPGADKRSAYVLGMLRRLGFKASHEGNLTEASMRTQDRKRWAVAYSEVVRLMLSVKDLDLGDAEPGRMERMFLSGFTYLQRCLSFEGELVGGSDEARAALYRNALSSGYICEGDRTALTGVFVGLMEYKPSRILPLLSGFSVEELDRVFEYLYDLECASRESGDAKRARKIVALENRLEKFIKEKLPPKE